MICVWKVYARELQLLTYAYHPYREISHQREISATPVLCFSFDFTPGGSQPLDVRLEISTPGVSLPATFPLSLGVPRLGLPSDTGNWISQTVTNLSPSSSPNFIICWHLLCSLPESDFANLLWPVDFQDSSKTAVYEGLYSVDYGFCQPPSLCSL